MSIQQTKVQTGAQNRHNADLSTLTLTTTDFFTPRVVYSKEFIPGESWRLGFDSMTRCMPLYKPAYANIKHHVRAFFVPYRTLLANWNEWIENDRVAFVSNTFVPYFTNKDVIEFFQFYSDIGTGSSKFASIVEVHSNPLSEDPPQPTPPSHYDFMYYNSYFSQQTDDVVSMYVTLNKRGKLIWNILLGLGYKFDTVFDVNASESDVPDFYDYKSALPLLSYCKVQLDYYINTRNQYTYKSLYAALRNVFLGNCVHLSGTVAGYTFPLFWDLLLALVDVDYNLDYFTSAWENPNGPDSGMVQTGINYRDPAYTVSSGKILNNYVLNNLDSIDSGTGAQVVAEADTTLYTNVLSQYLDTALHIVSDNLKRWQLSGMRAVDRYLSDYGIKLQSEYDNRTVYLGVKSSDFTIQDVTSTGSSEDLAKYKGKALDYNLDGSFDFNGSEFGFIVLVSTVVPQIKYYTGEKRYVHELAKTNFFKPQQEKLAVQAIRADELFCGYTHSNQLPDDMADFVPPNQTIGFTDMYGHLKCEPHAIVSGDFAFDSTNEGMDAWHVLRNINSRYAKITEDFRSTTDRTQYDRIFEIQDGKNDGFIQVFKFDVNSSLPLAPMFESYEWSDENGKEVTQQTNGSFMN